MRERFPNLQSFTLCCDRLDFARQAIRSTADQTVDRFDIVTFDNPIPLLVQPGSSSAGNPKCRLRPDWRKLSATSGSLLSDRVAGFRWHNATIAVVAVVRPLLEKLRSALMSRRRAATRRFCRALRFEPISSRAMRR